MPKDTLTLALNGEAALDGFADAMRAFEHLLKGLSQDVLENGTARWTVADLEYGSAIVTVRGLCRGLDGGERAVERVVGAYEEAATAMQRGEPVPYRSAAAPARRLVGLINGAISSIRFETADFDAEVFGDASAATTEPLIGSVTYGAVRGRVQSLSRRAGLRFTLYDLADDAAVSCYLTPEMEPKMREAWGRIADVEGLVRRNPRTGRPTVVRQVTEVAILPDEGPGAWRAAVGLLTPGADRPEMRIRRARDAD